MKYGMNMLLWTADVTENDYGILEQLKGIGFDGVELPIFDMDADKFTRLGRKLDEIGLERTAVTVCSECAAVGATKLCGPLHSALGAFTGQGPTDVERSRAKETLSQAAEYAQQAGVTLVLEFLNRFECYFLNCSDDCARFVREVNHPHLKMMYDTFHANIEEKNPSEAIKSCADQLVHVHISENDRSTPGEGSVDWDSTFAALKEVGYDEWMVVEAFGLALPDLAAATKIWRKMYPSEQELATNALSFMKSRWEAA
jgi:D-psicose/D-tagatose/L-ribulose 3-epimerase